MVTDNHYRWDFIQLSTDTKPTPSTSPKVADGSTLYTSDDSKLYIWYQDQWYEKEVEGGGGGTSYTAGDGIVIDNDEISVDLAQSTGTSTTNVMSQKAVTDALASAAIGTTESYTITTNNWSALSASSPYTYSATVTATYTIGNNTIAELINDNAVAFSNYGFAIGSISGQNVTIYSIGQPDTSVTLKVNYKG